MSSNVILDVICNIKHMTPLCGIWHSGQGSLIFVTCDIVATDSYLWHSGLWHLHVIQLTITTAFDQWQNSKLQIHAISKTQWPTTPTFESVAYNLHVTYTGLRHNLVKQIGLFHVTQWPMTHACDKGAYDSCMRHSGLWLLHATQCPMTPACDTVPYDSCMRHSALW